MRPSSDITGYHAHVYFDAETVGKARALCEAASDALKVEMGRVHERNVGPHPRWSCQLAFQAQELGEVLPWLVLNRAGLTVFIHAETGDDLKDHTEHDIWLGEMLPLDLSIFDRH
ncbi:MAG: DOPA 4,5-dioxygenase family protein [Pseudomonadota bacterium]